MSHAERSLMPALRYRGQHRIVSASDIAAFAKNVAERPPEPARLILDPLDRKLVHNSRDMDRLSHLAGSISLSSYRLCIHDHHAGQAPKTCAMNHSGIGYTGTQCRHGNLGAPQFLG